MKIPLVGQSYPSRSAAAGVQQTINVYPEIIEDPAERAKNTAVLYGCPGRHAISAAPAGTLRCVWSGGGRLFVIHGAGIGGAIYSTEIASSGALVTTDALPGGVDDGKPAQIFSNGNQLLIIAGGKAYCDSGLGPILCGIADSAGTVDVDGTGVTWTDGEKFVTDESWTGAAISISGAPYTILAVIDDTHLTLTSSAGTATAQSYDVVGEPLTAVTGGFIDGYFVVQRPPLAGTNQGRQFNLSAINDGNSWNGLDFGRKDGYPDNIRGILVDNEQLYLFGEETVEAWQDTGGANFPFQRLSNGMARYGSISPWAQVSLDGQVYFLGGDDRGQVTAYVIDGFTPKRISTHAEESVWNSAGLGPSAVAYPYLEEGHSFWVINFGAQTWAYDPATQAWHQRAGWDGTNFTAHSTKFHTFLPEWGAGGTHVTGGTDSPNVYQSSVNFYDDNASDIKWSRTLPFVYAANNRVFWGRIDLEMETGTVEAGHAAPTVTLSYSDDRGHTFTNPRAATLGAHGDYTCRVYWLRNGSSRGRALRLEGVGQSKVALIDLEADITPGTV
jgi:hypothetical protein